MKIRLHAVCVFVMAFWASTSGLQALSAAREWHEQLLSAIRQTIHQVADTSPDPTGKFYRVVWSAVP